MKQPARMRYNKFIPIASGGYEYQPHFTLTQKCAVCGKMAKLRLNDGKLLSINHLSSEDQEACPVIKQQNRMGPEANLAFNYADLEDRMYAAKAALRREDARISRLDGRPERRTERDENKPIDSATLEDSF